MTLLDRSPDQPECGMRDDGGLLFERDEEPGCERFSHVVTESCTNRIPGSGAVPGRGE